MPSPTVDARFTALRGMGYTGALQDMLFQYLAARGGGSTGGLNDRWRAMLITQGVAAGPLNDMWFTYLRSRAFIGSLSDMEYAFWNAGGTIP